MNKQITDFLPNALDAEQQLIGAVMMFPDSWYAASEHVDPAHFYDAVHATLWALLCERMNRGESVSPPAVIAAMGTDAERDLCGLTVKAYIARIAVEAAPASIAPGLAKVVREMWQRRQLIVLSKEIQARAMSLDGADVESLLEEADTQMGAVRFGKQVAGVASIGELAERSVRQTGDTYQLDGRAGYDTGIAVVDDMLGPMMAGDLVTVLAPSGHGKSALGTQILYRNCSPSLDANRGVPGVLISMEMEGVQVARRQLASLTGIAVRQQKAGEIVQGEFEQLQATASALRRIPFYVDYSGRQKVSQVIRKLRAMKKAYGIRLAVVDHYKLFRQESPRQNKFDVIEDAAKDLKDAAKELDMLIVGLAQVTRESQKREHTWRVKASDLWGGDTVKECSDIFITCVLPHRWLVENEPDSDRQKEHGEWAAQADKWFGRAELSGPKLRDGPPAAPTACKWDGKRMLFGDL